MKSKRIPLWFGVLKIRHREQLLFEERHGKVPVWEVGNYCLAWWANANGHDVTSSAAKPVPVRHQSNEFKSDAGIRPSAKREPIVFAVALRAGQWIIQFDGDYYGPCSTKEAALDAAYLMAVDAAAKGFDPQVRMQELN